ncbi:MAG TPA: MFS transporter [Candidatus Limnocylindrales bacterium]|nr:MFS transporter [Candidatus Limnocylindrales bacterium]
MLLAGIVLGLIVGLLAGGSLTNLVAVRLRWMAAIFGALFVRYLAEFLIARGVDQVDALRLPIFAFAFCLLLAALWLNRRQPGLSLAFVGILSNASAIVINGGRMPILDQSLAAVGLTAADASTPFHSIIASTDPGFLLRLGPLTDIIPIPIVGDVASIGDVFLGLGLAFFVFATLIREPDEPDEFDEAVVRRRLTGLAGTSRLPTASAAATSFGMRLRPETGLASGLAEGASLAAPALVPLTLEPAGASTAAVGNAGTLALPRPGVLRPATVERVRRHPYTRLALNSAFSSLWAGNLISLFGDRVHQVALAFLVLGITGSPLAVAATFISATLPNLLLGPLAGTLVDRWNQKDVLIVSDVLRAAAVLLVPVAAIVNVFLVFPLVFAITTVSVFFRPAKDAVLPRLVAEDQLVAANSVRWLGETLADIVGYPLAGLFATFLGSALPLAFWFDAVTYLASAVLVAAIAIPPAPRSEESAAGEGVLAELRAGWRFLRGQQVLLANTIQGVTGQVALGVVLVITPIYAAVVIAPNGGPDEKTAYALLETAVGLGNLVAGFAIGLVGARLAKGRMVVAGFIIDGLSLAGLGLVGGLPAALALMVGSGVGNMVYVIPSQTLFQQLTPPDMMGRVLGFRFAAVFGAMTLAMGVGGIVATIIGVQATFLVFGVAMALTGVAGLFVRSVREA